MDTFCRRCSASLGRLKNSTTRCMVLAGMVPGTRAGGWQETDVPFSKGVTMQAELGCMLEAKMSSSRRNKDLAT